MNRTTLGWIAIGGLGLGAACLSLAYALGGRSFDDLRLGFLLGPACHGDGKAKQREARLAWDDGDAVELALPATVYWRGGEGSDVIVRGLPDLVAHVEVRGGRITLNCRGGSGARNLELTLPGRIFRRIAISGSGKLVMENMNQPELALSISGSGSGSMRAQGAVDRAKITVTGSGHANLGDLVVKQLTLTISGSGKVEANPRDSADINIAGSGDVRLLGRPANLRTSVAGSGRITSVP